MIWELGTQIVIVASWHWEAKSQTPLHGMGNMGWLIGPSYRSAVRVQDGHCLLDGDGYWLCCTGGWAGDFCLLMKFFQWGWGSTSIGSPCGWICHYSTSIVCSRLIAYPARHIISGNETYCCIFILIFCLDQFGLRARCNGNSAKQIWHSNGVRLSGLFTCSLNCIYCSRRLVSMAGERARMVWDTWDYCIAESIWSLSSVLSSTTFEIPESAAYTSSGSWSSGHPWISCSTSAIVQWICTIAAVESTT